MAGAEHKAGGGLDDRHCAVYGKVAGVAEEPCEDGARGREDVGRHVRQARPSLADRSGQGQGDCGRQHVPRERSQRGARGPAHSPAGAEGLSRGAVCDRTSHWLTPASRRLLTRDEQARNSGVSSSDRSLGRGSGMSTTPTMRPGRLDIITTRSEVITASGTLWVIITTVLWERSQRESR